MLKYTFLRDMRHASELDVFDCQKDKYDLSFSLLWRLRERISFKLHTGDRS